MYTINIHHKGDDAPTTYTIYRKKEADSENLEYKYWREAKEGEYGISDDEFVAKVISKSIYNPSSIYVRYPYGYTFFNPKYNSTKRRMKKEKFKDMVREELQSLLKEHGMTEEYTLQLLSDTIDTARAKGDVTNLMRAVDNLQDMHGMKEKNQIKTVEQIEATSNTKLIDELRETEEKLTATKTTIKEED
jgi:hypothetical protein